MKAVNLLPADRHSSTASTGLDPNRRNLLIICAVVGCAHGRRALDHGLVVGLVRDPEAQRARGDPVADRDDLVGHDARVGHRHEEVDRHRTRREQARLGSVPRHALEGHARGRLASEPAVDDGGSCGHARRATRRPRPRLRRRRPRPRPRPRTHRRPRRHRHRPPPRAPSRSPATRTRSRRSRG